MSLDGAGAESGGPVTIRTVHDWGQVFSGHSSCDIEFKTAASSATGDGKASAQEIYVLRPFLHSVEKRDAIRYCEENGLSFVTDPTNLDVSYTRNAIRGHFDTLGSGSREDADTQGGYIHDAIEGGKGDGGGSRVGEGEEGQGVGLAKFPSQAGSEGGFLPHPPTRPLSEDIEIVHSTMVEASMKHFENVQAMLSETVQKSDAPGADSSTYQVDVSKLSKYPRVLVEDMVVELVALVQEGRSRRKPRLKSIERLCNLLLSGREGDANSVKCTPVPKTNKQLYHVQFVPRIPRKPKKPRQPRRKQVEK